jgi:hypothetical protein
MDGRTRTRIVMIGIFVPSMVFKESGTSQD